MTMDIKDLASVLRTTKTGVVQCKCSIASFRASGCRATASVYGSCSEGVAQPCKTAGRSAY